MGVSMCSQVCYRPEHSFYDVERTEEWPTPDEFCNDGSESFYSDEGEYFHNPMGMQSKSLPSDLNRVWREVSAKKRIRSEQFSRPRGYSLEDRMKERHQVSMVDREAEDVAERYCELVREDSARELRRTISVARSIAEKGSDINKELARQGQVISTAERDISIAEFELDSTVGILKGMSSLRGKFAQVVGRNKPKPGAIPCGNMNMDLMNGEASLLSFSKLTTDEQSFLSEDETEDTCAKEISKGIGQLNRALDVISIQQKEAAWALNKHEESLSAFEGQIATTHGKIRSQSQMMKKIVNKS